MNRKLILTVLFIIAIFILLLLSLSLNWIGANFGGVTFDEILFHLNMPLKGTGGNYVQTYITKAVLPAAGIIVEALVLFFIIRAFLQMFPKAWEKVKNGLEKVQKYSVWAGIVIIVVWLSAASVRAQNWFGFFDFVQGIMQRTNFFEEEYIDPKNVTLTFPEKKRNLIYILVESAESSSMDKASGGLMNTNYIPELTTIAQDNVSFSHSDRLEGAAVPPLCGWTIAGMCAETAGLPLKLYASNTVRANNAMDEYAAFLPGATSLGDILEAEGYHNVFMCGSDAEFGGRLNFVTQHGNYEIFDYYRAIDDRRILSGYKVWWGFEDEKLFEWAKEELTVLAKEDQPFNFTVLTVDTHSQDGWVCDLCRNETDSQYGNVWRCASRQIDAFVKWIQEQPFYENTTVIIAGDHCSMDKDFYGDYGYERNYGESTRKVYNAFLNSAVEPERETGRLFTTLDFFPSTLAAMGVKIEGDRLGLGVNLFGDEQTLAEKYGYDYMFGEMRKTSVFYDRELLYPKGQ